MGSDAHSLLRRGSSSGLGEMLELWRIPLLLRAKSGIMQALWGQSQLATGCQKQQLPLVL
jgi:hypothetical protein